MFSISYAVYFFILATAVAWLEIQIEGPYGWAAKIPCWRPNPESLLAKIYAKMMRGKPLTGYHVAMFSFVFIIFHFPFFAGVAWDLVKELEILSSYVLFGAYWDFLWFIWNPDYGLKKFKPYLIWWHKKWIKNKVPTDYPIHLGESIVFAGIASVLGGVSIIAQWGVFFSILTGLALLSCLISQLWRRGWA